jgi:CRP-like cAMP-binding protein
MPPTSVDRIPGVSLRTQKNWFEAVHAEQDNQQVPETPQRSTAAPSPSAWRARALLASAGAARSAVKYRPKDRIFKQGDPADAVFYIQQGKIQLTVVSEHGREGVIAMLGRGDFLGEGCLAGQPLHMASAFAMADSAVSRIDKATMVRVLREQPALSEMFMAFLLSRNIQIEADLVDQLFNSSERRLARVLLLLANFGKDGKMNRVLPKISQEVLAARWARRARGSTSS